MGLASSQARLLLLTARKSDLEYRAQMISQRKLSLAMQTEELATNYSTQMSNRLLYFTSSTDGSDGTETTEVLTYSGLTAAGQAAQYIITDASGNLIVPSVDSLPSDFKYDKTTGMATHANGQSFKVKALEGIDKSSYTYAFQNALRNGSLYIQQLTSDGFAEQAIQGSTTIKDQLYTNDDAQAQALYESESLKIQNQDKMLDLELKQIETQHSAIETEYDSVKKVIDKNIEVSYKIFANG